MFFGVGALTAMSFKLSNGSGFDLFFAMFTGNLANIAIV